MLDLVSSSSFEAITNQLLNGTGGILADPCLRHPRGRGGKQDWTELDLEEYLKAFPIPGGLTIDPEWWFPYKNAVNRRPTWDLVCHVHVDGKPGILLVEAKAHVSELSEQDKKSPPNPKSPRSRANDCSVRLRLCEASLALSNIGLGQFHLSADNHYQLSNRLAYLNKVAGEGVPTILMYLGWLKSPDWPDDPIRDAKHWRDLVEGYVKAIAPSNFIGKLHQKSGGGSMQMVVRCLEASSVSRPKN
jgi:hypothetical protein